MKIVQLIFVELFCLFAAGWQFRDWLKYRQCCEVQGLCIETHTTYRRGYQIAFQYIYNGVQYTETSSNNANLAPTVGSEYTLLVNPQKPQEYIMQSQLKSCLIRSLIFIAFAVFTAVNFIAQGGI